MKNTLNLLFAILALSIISCSDPCDDVNCNNGTCNEGTCLCDEGWQGVNCDQMIDPCADINCNNGSCNEGECTCDPGYEGEFCDTEIRAKYYGNYEGDLSACLQALGGGMIDTSMFGDFLTGSLIIGPGAAITEINLLSTSAFANFDEDVDIATPTFTIPETVTEFEDPTGSGFDISITASGIGAVIDENTITMNLIISISIDIIPIPLTSNCEITFTKV